MYDETSLMRIWCDAASNGYDRREADIRCAADQLQLCAESELCKGTRAAQNYRSRWSRTLRRSFPEAGIDTLLQHY